MSTARFLEVTFDHQISRFSAENTKLDKRFQEGETNYLTGGQNSAGLQVPTGKTFIFMFNRLKPKFLDHKYEADRQDASVLHPPPGLEFDTNELI